MGCVGAGTRDGWEPPDIHARLRFLEEQQVLSDSEPPLHCFMNMFGFLLPFFTLITCVTQRLLLTQGKLLFFF